MAEQLETINSTTAAKLLGLSPRYFSEKFIFQHPDFPRAFRYGGTGHRRFILKEVESWRDKHRDGG